MRSLTALILLLLVSCRHSADLVEQDDPGEAEEYYAMKRQGAADPHQAYAAARAQMSRMTRESSARPLTPASMSVLPKWQFLGPGNIGGRTRTLVVDPLDRDVMYSGGVSGGIWKTTNAGQRWEPIGDVLTNLAVNSLVIDPRDRNVLFAGTGEGYFREEQRGTALPLRGNGIFVTRDGGVTWNQLDSTTTEDFHFVNDLVISGSNSSRIYAATRTGVWRSADGGASWSRVLETNVKGGCLELTVRRDQDGDYLFASCGTFEQATVYRNQSAESDVAWDAVLSEPFQGRTSLAIAPSSPSTIYALSASNEPDSNRYQGLLAVFRSDQNGDAGTWTAQVRNTDPVLLNQLLLTNSLLAACVNNPTYTTMGWYCNVIAVDPADSERVWVGGVDLFRSDDGGRNWGSASYWWAAGSPAFAHADQHGIVFHPDYDGDANQTMFTTNDGGVFRTDNARAAITNNPCDDKTSDVRFKSLNHNFGVTQFYNGAVYPDGRAFLGGAQDNGTVKGTIDGGPDAWAPVFGGDGGYVAIDPRNADVLYVESQGGNLLKSENAGRNFRGARNGITDQFLFIAPFALDPNAPSTVWFGGRRMWRSTDGATTWTRVTAQLDGLVSAIAIARGDSARVLAGTNTGRIYRADDGWSATSPRDGFVSWLAFDPSDPSTAYATYAGFGGTHVWKSGDAGATWSPLDANLPDIPVHSIAIDPFRRQRLYLGTDLGVFVSTDGGASWMVEDTGFGPAVTETVLIGASENGVAVYAFTHGRGAWRAELDVPRRRVVPR